MSILLLSCIRGIRNGKGLLIRAGVCIPNAAPGQGSGAVGQSMGLGQLPFYLSFASVSLPDPLLPHPLAAPQGTQPCSGTGPILLRFREPALGQRCPDSRSPNPARHPLLCPD